MTHYQSITLGNDPVLTDNIIIYGNTARSTPHAEPNVCKVIKKPIEAIITTDDFSTWDYTNTTTLNTFNIWGSGGSAILSASAEITSCYSYIAVDVKPRIVVEGTEYNLIYFSCTTMYNVYAGEEYIGTSQSTDNRGRRVTGTESTYIVSIPHVLNFVPADNVPDGYTIEPNEYMFMVYSNENNETIIQVQPISINTELS